jgi:hypothetical protein
MLLQQQQQPTCSVQLPLLRLPLVCLWLLQQLLVKHALASGRTCPLMHQLLLLLLESRQHLLCLLTLRLAPLGTLQQSQVTTMKAALVHSTLTRCRLTKTMMMTQTRSQQVLVTVLVRLHLVQLQLAKQQQHHHHHQQQHQQGRP